MKKTAVFLLVILLFGLTSCTGFDKKNTEPVQRYVEDVNGDLVPAFENVDASSLDAKLFKKDENGRMYYDDPGKELLNGIDVSVFQGDVDWEKVAADDIDFVILRCGGRGYGAEGKLYEDTKFEENYKDAAAAGLQVGAYFYSQAVSVEEAIEEADYVIDIIKGKILEFPVVFDWEHVDDSEARTRDITGELVTEFANAFCERIRQAGFEPMVYLNCEFGYFKYDLSVMKENIWLAEYSDIPSYYYNYKIWQYSKYGSVDGIDGIVDMNIALEDISVG